MLTKFQQSIRTLDQNKEQIGSVDDNYDFRQAIIGRIKETNEQMKVLQQEITNYGDISIPFN